MSSSNVANPIPQNTRTINDMLSSYDSKAYESKISLSNRRISLRNKDEQSSNDMDYSNNEYSGYKSTNDRIKKKRNLTLSK